MLEIKNLNAGYGKLKVLENINLEIEPNQIISLIGPNGAGKSTIIKSIFNIADVYKGKITFKNENITKIKTHNLINLGISYVPQGKINFPSLTIKENLLLGANLIKDKEIINKNLNHVYEKFPVLKTKQNHLAYTLSGGQQQMLAIGRALMQKPSLLLLDEPSLGLSPKLQKRLFKLIKSLKEEGISILMVEQNAKKAIEISDKVCLLEEGKIVLKGDKRILKNKKIKSVYLGGRY